jgi:hypothetical protein
MHEAESARNSGGGGPSGGGFVAPPASSSLHAKAVRLSILREEYMTRLLRMAPAQPQRRPGWHLSRDAMLTSVPLIDMLRSVTVEVVEAVVGWRGGISPDLVDSMPFLHAGVPYLLKVAADCEVLSSAVPGIETAAGIAGPLARHPMLLPPHVFTTGADPQAADLASADFGLYDSSQVASRVPAVPSGTGSTPSGALAGPGADAHEAAHARASAAAGSRAHRMGGGASSVGLVDVERAREALRARAAEEAAYGQSRLLVVDPATVLLPPGISGGGQSSSDAARLPPVPQLVPFGALVARAASVRSRPPKPPRSLFPPGAATAAGVLASGSRGFAGQPSPATHRPGGGDDDGEGGLFGHAAYAVEGGSASQLGGPDAAVNGVQSATVSFAQDGGADLRTASLQGMAASDAGRMRAQAAQAAAAVVRPMRASDVLAGPPPSPPADAAPLGLQPDYANGMLDERMSEFGGGEAAAEEEAFAWRHGHGSSSSVPAQAADTPSAGSAAAASQYSRPRVVRGVELDPILPAPSGAYDWRVAFSRYSRSVFSAAIGSARAARAARAEVLRRRRARAARGGDDGDELGADEVADRLRALKAGTLRVEMPPGREILRVRVDLHAVLGSPVNGRAWVGFTAATGDLAYQAHEVLAWKFDQSYAYAAAGGGMADPGRLGRFPAVKTGSEGEHSKPL